MYIVLTHLIIDVKMDVAAGTSRKRDDDSDVGNLTAV